MTARVLLFAGAKAAIGQSSVELQLPAGATVADLYAELAYRFPQLRSLLLRSAIAVNQRIAQPETPIGARDEIAWIPPVSGG